MRKGLSSAVELSLVENVRDGEKRLNSVKKTSKRKVFMGFLLSTLLFILFTALGFTTEIPYMVMDFKELEAVLGFLRDLPRPALALIIFINNFVKSLLLIPLGAVLGLPPAAFLAFNGFVLGAVLKYSSSILGFEAALASIVPHGVVEVPSILFASALALNVGWEVWRRLFGKRGRVKDAIKAGLRSWLKWGMLPLALAAVIEVYVTPVVVRLVT